MATQSSSKFQKKWISRFKRGGMNMLFLLASKKMWALFILLSIGMSGWMLYRYAWQPLQQEVTDPAGVTPTNAKLQEKLLQDINNSRIERSGYSVRSYARYKNVFQNPSEPLSLPSPTPSFLPTPSPVPTP